MSGNNNGEADNIGNRNGNVVRRRRKRSSRRDTTSKNRERSTSTESYASNQSCGLEWDHSADLGVIESATTSFEMYTIGSFQNNVPDLGELVDTPSSQTSVSIVKAGEGKITSWLGYSSSQCLPNLVNAYSTPSTSPVPPPSIDYSPVESGDLGAAANEVQEYLKAGTQTESNPNPPSKKPDHADSSESNKITMDDCRTIAGLFISGASSSSDRKDDTGKTSRYVPDWRTNGITRSEIEYQNRKKKGVFVEKCLPP